MKLELKDDSWKNVFDTIKGSDIKPISNFWASIQSLQEQFDKSKLFTCEDLKSMKEFEIFKIGEEIIPEVTSAHPVKWVAVKGGGFDWAIYCGYTQMDDETISRVGDKIFTESAIKRLINCDEEFFNRYRY